MKTLLVSYTAAVAAVIVFMGIFMVGCALPWLPLTDAIEMALITTTDSIILWLQAALIAAVLTVLAR